MAAHLSSGRINVAQIREAARREIVDLLKVLPGPKTIILEDEVLTLTRLVFELELLKNNGVEKFIKFDINRRFETVTKNVIFFVRPCLESMETIAENIRIEESHNARGKEFAIFFLPRVTKLCELKLIELGVYANLKVYDYPLEIFPLDCDLLSLEIPTAFRDCTIESDRSSLLAVARAIMVLQSLFGIIPNVYGKGPMAQSVFDLMVRLRREMGGKETQLTPQIDNLLLIDRSVDPVTPMMTQLTYAGLLDEQFGIVCNRLVKGEEEISGVSQMILDSSDLFFAELRDKNFAAVPSVFSKTTKFLTSQYDERHGLKTVSQIKEFVGKLPRMEATKKSVAEHMPLAQGIKDSTTKDTFLETIKCEKEFARCVDTDKPSEYIEDCIAKEDSLFKVLRLICVQCCVNNGLKPKVLEHYKREILQTYGFQHLLTLKRLEKCGLLKVHNNTKNYRIISKTLNLTTDDLSDIEPTDISYVYSGYAPLSVRLAEYLSNPGWRSITGVLAMLPGPTVDEIQTVKPVQSRKQRNSNADERHVTLVFFLGGCTFAEIAALRFLSNQEDSTTEYIVGTTSITTGTRLLESCAENLQDYA